MRLPRLWWRTREARRSGDVGALIRSVTTGGGRAVGLRVRGNRVLILQDPALAGALLVEHAPVTIKGPGVRLTRQLLGDGLLTSEGAPHDRARRLIAPAFSPRRLAGYTESFAAATRRHIAGWDDAATLDAHSEMAALTLDIVGRTLLGIDLADRASTVRGSLESALERFAKSGGGILRGTGQRGIGQRGLRAALRARQANPAPDQTPDPAEAAVHRVVDEVINHRRADPTDDRGDVVAALLSYGEIRNGMSAAEIHDHVMTLLLAGHETTANALTFTLFLLGKHPQVQDRLLGEVSTFAAAGPTFTDLPALSYTRAVISEALRLYPPAWLLGRTIVAPLEFGGWHAPAGTVVLTSPMLLHRDPRWFPEPDTFDPTRWLDDRRHDVPKYAYLPFGTGPRACIGEQFAWAEAITALAVIAANWRVHTDPDLTPGVQYRVTLRPSGAVPIRVAARRSGDSPAGTSHTVIDDRPC
jgi:cytochrome P450